MPLKKKKEIEKRAPQEVKPLAEKPSYLSNFEQKGAIKGSSNFDSSDVTIPRIKLIQAMSKEPETFNNAKAGEFWHTGMDLPMGTEFNFVPVSRRKKYLLVAPIDDGRGILARSDDFVHWNPPQGEFSVKLKGRKEPQIWKVAPTIQESGLGLWGTYNDQDPASPPAATLFYEYLSLLPDRLDLGPVVISMTRSQIKKAKKGLNDKIAMHESAGRPMQSLVFKATVVKETAQLGSYFNWQFTSNGFTPEALFKQAYELKDALRTYRVQDEEGAAQEDPEAADAKDY